MDIIPPQRTCSKCGQSYPLTVEYWHKDKKSKSGFTYACKECAKKRASEWLADNRERNKETCKRRYYAKPEARKQYIEDNREHYLETKREWRKNNPDKVKAHKSESQKRNRESANERNRRYTKRHPERVRVRTLENITRRMGAKGFHTAEDVQKLYDRQEGRCAYCGITLHGVYEVDHIWPVSRGGSNWANNLAIACPSCNSSKHNKSIDEWKATRGW